MSNKNISIFIAFLFLLNSISIKSNGQDKSTVINKLLEGIGGEESLREARYIMFSSVNEGEVEIQKEHTYIYDWETKDCRFEGKTKDGDALTVLFNPQSDSGETYLNNERNQNPELLKSIIQLFKKDSYFLFTPILIANKSLSPVVQNPEIIDSKRYFILRINSTDNDFESAKLYIDSRTGIIDKWDIFNKDHEKTHEFLASEIKDVGGGLTLATKFTDTVSGITFQYPIVAALLNIETSKFKNL